MKISDNGLAIVKAFEGCLKPVPGMPGHFRPYHCPANVLTIGYGHTGPKANRGGYDIIAQGEAGLMALTGPVDGGPTRFPSPMADISGGIYTCMGVLAALGSWPRRGGSKNPPD